MALRAGYIASTTMSKSLPEARQRAVRLYRECMREVPRMIALYELDVSEREARSIVREQYTKHSSVQDPAAIDLLTFRGLQDLAEIHQVWKTKAQVQQLFTPPKDRMQALEDGNLLRRILSGNHHRQFDTSQY